MCLSSIPWKVCLSRSPTASFLLNPMVILSPYVTCSISSIWSSWSLHFLWYTIFSWLPWYFSLLIFFYIPGSFFHSLSIGIFLDSVFRHLLSIYISLVTAFNVIMLNGILKLVTMTPYFISPAKSLLWIANKNFRFSRCKIEFPIPISPLHIGIATSMKVNSTFSSSH